MAYEMDTPKTGNAVATVAKDRWVADYAGSANAISQFCTGIRQEATLTHKAH